MHNAIAANLSADIKAALTALNKDPLAMRRVYREINKVLHDTFSTQIFFITPGCCTSNSTLVDHAYAEASKMIRYEFNQAYQYSHWDHLNEQKFINAMDRLLYNIHYSLTLETPARIYIYRSKPGNNPDSTYPIQWAGDARFGLYVKVVQINGSEKEFDLIETYNNLP